MYLNYMLYEPHDDNKLWRMQMLNFDETKKPLKSFYRGNNYSRKFIVFDWRWNFQIQHRFQHLDKSHCAENKDQSLFLSLALFFLIWNQQFTSFSGIIQLKWFRSYSAIRAECFAHSEKRQTWNICFFLETLREIKILHVLSSRWEIFSMYVWWYLVLLSSTMWYLVEWIILSLSRWCFSRTSSHIALTKTNISLYFNANAMKACH